MQIREFRLGDEPALRTVFYSAVHGLASRDYTPEQLDAWAPRAYDAARWAERMQTLRPFVVEDAGRIAAYASVNPSGFIDHFFVATSYARRGLGTLLMTRIHQAAEEQGVAVLESHVSLTAQPFFKKFGFTIVEQRLPVVSGVALSNAAMRKELVLEHPVRS
ncbi:MAG: GNAT family N-acetyltransferase [Planctomycetia bacterium]|nr:GNAT family N-acetyltransferase [Planctomycetia bacterium]